MPKRVAQGNSPTAGSREMKPNFYQQIIADGLKVDDEKAKLIQNFINVYFDDFRWSSATKIEIIKTAKEAQKFIDNPKFAELLSEVNA